MTRPPKPARTNHLVLMLKTPKMGTVKTRLAKDIGTGAATNFYRTTSHRLITQLSQDPRWQTFLAISPDASLNNWPWPKSAMREPQGNGDLGARMQAVFNNHAPHPTLIIGTDIPAIKPWHIIKAFKVLHRTGFVIAPSGDGGYWCVGQKMSPRQLRPFQNVRWSTKHSYNDTIANLAAWPALTSNINVPQLKDIDDGQDHNNHHRHSAGRWLARP